MPNALSKCNNTIINISFIDDNFKSQKEEKAPKSPTSDDSGLKPNGLFQENGQSINDDEEEDWHSM